MEEHSLEFADKGIEPNQIPDAIITAVTQGKIIGYQGRKKLVLFMKLILMAKPNTSA